MDMHEVVATLKGPSNGLQLRQGMVVSVQAGSITVTIGGSTTQIAGVKVLSSCCPIPGSACWLITDGRDLIAVDTQAPVAYLSAYRQATQIIGTGAWTKMSFDTVSDNSGMQTSATDYTVKVPGVYQVSAQAGWGSSSTGLRAARVLYNGAHLGYAVTVPQSINTSTQVPTLMAMVLGGVVTFEVWQNTGGDITTLGGIGWSYLRLAWLGAR